MDELLVKYLLGEASDTEAQSVRDWIAAHEDNRRYYDHFKMIWEQSLKLAATSTVDEEQAWQRFQVRVSNAAGNDDEERTVPFTPVRRSRVFRYAAAIAILLAGSFTGFYFWSLNRNEVVLASAGKVTVDTLPDGSVITLNKNSELAYNSKDFNRTDRKVKLSGEAFFNVAPNKQKPFEISVDEIKVHVVGTSFNIKSTAVQTEVIVETGIVKVGVKNQAVKLLPQEKVVVRKKERTLTVEQNRDDLYNYYRTRKFICNNTPLYQLTDALNNAYGTKITIHDERIRNLRINTTFKEMSLNDILKVITETFNLQIEQKSGEIILK